MASVAPGAADPDHRVIYRTARAGGADVPLALEAFLPEGEARGTVLYLHPGGFDKGGAEMLHPFAREITARGMAAVAVAYRLRPHGRAELSAPFADLTGQLFREVPGEFGLRRPFAGRPCHAATEDALAALRWIADRGAGLGLDPVRLMLAGVSAGGMAAANLAFTVPALGLARPPLAAVAILSGALGNLARCDLGTGPALFWAHGTGDRLVPVANARAVAEAARGRAAPTEFHFFEHRVHGHYLYQSRHGLPGATPADRRGVVWDFLARNRDYREAMPCSA